MPGIGFRRLAESDFPLLFTWLARPHVKRWYAPEPRSFMELLARYGDLASTFGLDYARTLAAWRERFLAEWDGIAPLGFDDRFIRMWEYYLALCEAGFATGVTQDHQLVLEKGRGHSVRSVRLRRL